MKTNPDRVSIKFILTSYLLTWLLLLVIAITLFKDDPDLTGVLVASSTGYWLMATILEIRDNIKLGPRPW